VAVKAVVKRTVDGQPRFFLEEAPEPCLEQPVDVKIAISAIGVCASDVHALHGAMHVPDGNIVGHEFSGTVVETGPAAGAFAPGDRVVAELAVGRCGTCPMCRAGHYEFCPSKRPPGWVSQGVYTETIVLDAGLLHRVPDGVSREVAALAEPVAICVYGCLERAAVRPGDSTVIFGVGSIGLISLVTLKDRGAGTVVCVAPASKGRKRLDLAVELGADAVLTPGEDLGAVLERLTGSRKADCVVECSGAPEALNQGIEALRKDGTMVCLGIASRPLISIAWNTAVLNAARFVFSSTSSHSSWCAAICLLERRGRELERVVTHRLPLEQWQRAYDALGSREAVKAVLYP
jgi:L-iditol 2-dehydrogenase